MRQPRSPFPGVLATLLVTAIATATPAATPVPENLRDLYFGAALFHSLQGEHFDAISRLDAELSLHYGIDQPERDTMTAHRAEAELYIGDLELAYRMNRRGGRAMERLLADDVPAPIRNEAMWRLARLAYEKREYDKALAVLEDLHAEADPVLHPRATLLRGQVLIALERPAEAVEALADLDDDADEIGYGRYNRAIALLRDDRREQGLAILSELGARDADDRHEAALRDKANLALGFTLLEQERAEAAQVPLQRVRLEGPFSNKALLWYGWGDAARQRYESALKAWLELRERDPRDPAVQEALLAAPYAFTQLEAYGRAAVLYGEAVEVFGRQVQRLDESIRSIREGRFLEALVERDPKPARDGSGAFELGDLPDQAPTRYLADLMAGRSFQQGWLNYRDLSDLLQRVERWQAALPAFRDLIADRRAYYEPLLPEIRVGYDERAARLAVIGERLEDARAERERLLREYEPMALATSDERAVLARIERLRDALPPGTSPALRHRVDRLEGVLTWNLRTTYADRLSAFHEHIEALDRALQQADASRFSLLKRIEQVPLLYSGHGQRLEQLGQRLGYLGSRIEAVRAQQGRFIEQMAIAQLNARKDRLRRYQTKARFAAAENYDRATASQQDAGTEPAPTGTGAQ
jgi:hypothetical protein